MIHQVIITLLAFTSTLHIHAAGSEDAWPIRIQLSGPSYYYDEEEDVEMFSTVDSVYHLHEHQPVPFEPTSTLGQMCHRAHQHNVPWCFLIGKVKTTTSDQIVTTRTCYFDAAIIYRFMQQNRLLQDNLPYLRQLSQFIANQAAHSETTHVTLMACNRYPNGLTIGLNPGEEDQLGLQLHYTLQLLDNKKPIDLTGFRHLVFSKCVRYIQRAHSTQKYLQNNILSIKQQETEQRELEKAKKEAQFWLQKYQHNRYAQNSYLNYHLLLMDAFQLINY
jgi:hypothetical protein